MKKKATPSQPLNLLTPEVLDTSFAEREFYIRMALRERWSSRQLQRQFNASLFARVVLHPPKVPAVLAQSHPGILEFFRDSYVLEFLNLPADHSEADLHRSLLRHLKDFIIEIFRIFGNPLRISQDFKGMRYSPKVIAKVIN